MLDKQNHKDVLVVVDSEDYPELLEFLNADKDDQQFRRKLAWKAFQHVASYDSAVSEWLWKQTSEGTLIFLFLVTIELAFVWKNELYSLTV
jgi:phosphoribosylaminoimidazolecarboxamide formyltransferase/IMP cyclohydrolase